MPSRDPPAIWAIESEIQIQSSSTFTIKNYATLISGTTLEISPCMKYA